MDRGFAGINKLAEQINMEFDFPEWLSAPHFYNNNHDCVLTDLHQGLEQYVKLFSIRCTYTNDANTKYQLEATVFTVYNGVRKSIGECKYLYTILPTTRKMSRQRDAEWQYIPTDKDVGNCMANTRFVRRLGELMWWIYTGDNFYYGRDIQNLITNQQNQSQTTASAPINKVTAVELNMQRQKATANNNAKADLDKDLKFAKWALVVIAIIAAFVLYGESDKDEANTALEKPTTQSVRQPAKKVKIEPVARAGVITGYDSDGPYLNDDGMCELTIDNTRNDMPVYVRLWDMEIGRPVRAFYIRSGDSFTATELTPSTYEVRYIELYDNDVPAQGSRSEQFTMEQVDYGSFVQYSQMSLTLYKVHGGNTTTTSIDADDI